MQKGDDCGNPLTPLKTEGDVNQNQSECDQDRLQGTGFQFVSDFGTDGFNPSDFIYFMEN